MADDNNARYRSSDPFAHSPAPGGQGSDPLAELARLIGQNDPFSELGRESRAALRRQPQPYDDPAPQPELPYDPRYDAPLTHDPAPPPADWQSQPASYDPSVSAAYPAPPAAASHGYEEPAAQRPTFHTDLTFPRAQSHHAGFDVPPASAAPRHAPGFPMPLSADGGSLPLPNADDYYDDAPQGGRRKGLITVVAVLCLAVVGTAGAFGYRTWFGGPTVKSPPPVIRASAEPSKVAPPQSSDPSANKISYDRFGDRGQNEQVVAREEKPVDVRDAMRSAPVRAVVPGAVNSAAPLAAASAFANPPSVLTEPKRVRTVPIRPDMPDASAARPAMAAPPAAPTRAPTVVATAPSNSNMPLDLANPSAPAPQARAAAPRREPSPPPAPAGNAPLSLAPADSAAPLAAPPRATPARVASAPAGNGSYLVQVSSQRSEADAQTAFRNIQSKYSSVLGDRQPVIKRAELAGKGTYYRAMVGPFTTRDQAIQLCSSLKSAGGDCVVQSN